MLFIHVIKIKKEDFLFLSYYKRMKIYIDSNDARTCSLLNVIIEKWERLMLEKVFKGREIDKNGNSSRIINAFTKSAGESLPTCV